MIKKARLLEENAKLIRKIFIFEHIGIGYNASIQEKEEATKRFLELNPTFTAYEVCTTIGLSRGTFYNYLHHKVEETVYAKNEKLLTKEIIRIFNESKGLYGQNRIRIVLRQKGINTTTVTISKIMKENNLKVKRVIQRPSAKENNKKKKANYKINLLKQQFNQTSPNKVWVSDFLELKVNSVKFYICAILDLYSRKVIAWRLSHKRSEKLAINTFKDAFENRNEPEGFVFHTDQGGEFTSKAFMTTLKMLGVSQSFSFPGNPYDNAVMESFYSTLRKEEININIDKYENSLIIKQYLEKYIHYYNEQRIHTAIGMSPDQKEGQKNYLLNK